MKREKKKTPLAVVVIIAVVLLSAVSEADSDELVGIIGIIAVVAIIIAIVKILNKVLTGISGKTDKTVVHSHDRLSENTLRAESHDGFEHYKRQIDGFLAAGIIDKAEYKVLYDKYRRTLK